MIVIPAIDLRGGRAVRLLRGDPQEETSYDDDPVAVAVRFQEEGARRLHVVDLDAALDAGGDNREVIARQDFDLPVNFPSGQDRVYLTESLGNITIPRGTATTSGANFEVLVGFEVTPKMAEFNRLGKRFRVNAGTTAVASGSATQRR